MVDIGARPYGKDFKRLLGEDNIKLDRPGQTPKAGHQRGASLVLNQMLLQKPKAWVIAPELPGLWLIENQVREAHCALGVTGRATHQHTPRTILWFWRGLS